MHSDFWMWYGYVTIKMIDFLPFFDQKVANMPRKCVRWQKKVCVHCWPICKEKMYTKKTCVTEGFGRDMNVLQPKFAIFCHFSTKKWLICPETVREDKKKFMEIVGPYVKKKCTPRKLALQRFLDVVWTRYNKIHNSRNRKVANMPRKCARWRNFSFSNFWYICIEKMYTQKTRVTEACRRVMEVSRLVTHICEPKSG